MYFMKKVTFAARLSDRAQHQKSGAVAANVVGRCKPLLIKSPVHTARIKILLSIFPKARFVYIHRHPLQVFQSAANMAQCYYWYTYLHMPENRHILDFILEQYQVLYHAYLKQRGVVPANRLLEVRFEDLDAKPVDTIQAVYEHLTLGSFESVRRALLTYNGTLADFKKNHFNKLSRELQTLVQQRWSESFQTFGYS